MADEHAPVRPYVIETPEGEAAVYQGWKEISKALGVSEDAAFRASRREVDPLRVRYTPFGKPWIKRLLLDAWFQDNTASARQYDTDRAHERQKRVAAAAGQSGESIEKRRKHGRISRPNAGVRR